MIALALLSLGLLADAPPPAPDTKTVYETKRAQVGRDPSAHVKLALWCEQNGLPAERLKHLAMAVMIDPSNLTARGLMGLVSDNGTWRKPEEIADRARADAKLAADRAEYQTLRAKAKPDADSQYRLATWCEEHGLLGESRAHLSRVVQLDPKRDLAWKKLGYKKHDGVWLTDLQLVAARVEAEAQAKADHHWGPIINHAKSDLIASDGRKAEAMNLLSSISDPRSVPSVLKSFASKRESDQRIAAQILGQIDSPKASSSLAILAVSSKSFEVRRIATETLRRRDPREFAGVMIDALRQPIKYTVKRVEGPGKPGELWVEGGRYDRKRLYQSTPIPSYTARPGDVVTRDSNGNKLVVQTLSSFDTGPMSGADLFAFSTYPRLNTAPIDYTYTMPQVNPAAVANLGAMANQGSLGPHGSKLAHAITNAANNQATLAREQAAYYANPTLYGYPRLSSPYPYNYAMLPSPLGQVAWEGEFDPSVDKDVRGRPLNPNSYIDMLVGIQARIPIGRMEIEAYKSAEEAQKMLDSDVASIEAYNAPVHAKNRYLVPMIEAATGQAFGEDKKAWMAWMVDQIGYSLVQAQATARETVIDSIQPYQPRVPVEISERALRYSRISCFGAGTMVRTLDGQRPIESLQVGDLVLSQDEASGALSYQPILVVHRNPPAATLKIDIGGDAILSSTYHRFWLAGKGWAMARELKPGDRIRTLGGVATVKEIGADKVQPVFNLDVAESRTFFVGKAGALAHDNSVPERRLPPFDATSAD